MVHLIKRMQESTLAFRVVQEKYLAGRDSQTDVDVNEDEEEQEQADDVAGRLEYNPDSVPHPDPDSSSNPDCQVQEEAQSWSHEET